MGLFIKLSREKSRKIFLLFFSLASLLPILFLIFIIFYFVLPQLNPEQRSVLMPTFTYGVLILLGMSLVSFIIMSKWFGRLEHLTNEIRTKAVAIMTEKGLFEDHPGMMTESELQEIENVFGQLHTGLQDKIVQLNEYSLKMININQQMSKLAITDDLTALYNRRHFNTYLHEEIDRHQRYGHGLALLMIDIDNFKEFNDKNGHQEGDKLLRVIGKLLRKNIRKTDTAFRYGGDEFALLLPECQKENAISIAKKISGKIRDYPFQGREKLDSGAVTVSIGVAVYTDDIDDFLKAADGMLYQAKSVGNSQVVA